MGASLLARAKSIYYALIGQNLTGRLDYKTVRIFAYSSTREQSSNRSGTELKTESETLAPRFTDFFTDFEKKNDCFAVYMWAHAESCSIWKLVYT